MRRMAGITCAAGALALAVASGAVSARAPGAPPGGAAPAPGGAHTVPVRDVNATP